MRIPMWAAITIVVAAYLARSALRGFDFTPDLPLDAIIAVAVVFLLLLRRWATRAASTDESEEDRAGNVDDEDGQRGERG
jgi:hypothetical protein